jgi:beta-xylosidase
LDYALQKQPPFDVYDTYWHGNGVWAPCIPYHDEMFYIYYPDTDFCYLYDLKPKNQRGLIDNIVG